MYFECNLPTAVPMWMDPRAAIPFINTMAAHGGIGSGEGPLRRCSVAG